MKVVKILLFISLFTYVNADIVRVSDDVVKDTKTNFLWQDTIEVKDTRRTYQEAMDYCKNLTLDNKKGWNIPTFVAAFSIVDTKVYNPALPKEFKNFVSDNYWTDKSFSHGMSKEIFVVNYKSGAFNRKPVSDKHYIRCYKDLNK